VKEGSGFREVSSMRIIKFDKDNNV
jgi:hypothetical protein